MIRTPIHPGQILADELNELGLSVRGVGRALHVPGSRLAGILAGRQRITADTALRLGQYFGTSAEFWLNLQKLYELRLAEQAVGDEIRRTVSRRAAPAQSVV